MHPLEPTPDAMREMGRAATELVASFVEGRSSAPAADLEGAMDLARRLRLPPPETAEPGNDLARLLEVVDVAAAKAIDTAGPGYLAYVPGGGLFTAAIADFVACGLNRYVGVAGVAPALTQLEANVTRWLCDLFGYPAEARGVLTSGGSLANLSAVVTARVERLGADLHAGSLYVSDQAHHSVAKAARVAGMPDDAVRVVPTGSDLRMDPDEVDALVRDDRRRGRRPFLLVASAGTVHTGAVDPLAELASVATAHGLWLHVDAAYGGFFRLTNRGRTRLAGIEVADSITLDPHKGMFLPYGTGALVVRDGQALRRAHQGAASYLQDLAAAEEIPSFADYSPELSRDFRGLRVWLPLQLHGVAAFRAALDEKLDLARLAHERLAEADTVEVPWPPQLSTVAFRAAGGDESSRDLLRKVNASGRVFLSSTVVHGRFTLRMCVLSHRTHRDRVEEAVELVRKAAA